MKSIRSSCEVLITVRNMMLAARNDHKLIDKIYEEFGLGYLYTLKNTGKKGTNDVQLNQLTVLKLNDVQLINCDESEVNVASEILMYI